jgi:16S rRNA (cytosine1402-N4)-methyltransferase
MTDYHIPVLLKECIEALNIKTGGIYADATLGGGSHTKSILLANENIKVYAFDKDISAIDHCKTKLAKYENRLEIFNDNFKNLRTNLALSRVKKIDGILLDLGVSSHQIDNPAKGFSFSYDGKPDMRMNRNNELSAYDVVNEYSYADLKRIFIEYGEEKEAGRIARKITEKRLLKTIESTLELADIIDSATYSKQKIKAKARIFQALRIHVNNEIEDLKEVLHEAVSALNPGGRIVVISYHSLEDRIVKKFFAEEEKDCVCPNSFPKCVCSKVSTIKILTKKPINPSEAEIAINRRAKSAKLRIAEKKEVR